MPDKPFLVVAVNATNAHHVGSVFRSVYGEDFPVGYVYQPDALCKEIEAKRLSSALAFDSEGKPAGYVSMFKAAFNPRLWEAGNLVVNPVYTQANIPRSLARYYFGVMCRQAADADGIFGEAVCCHYYTQVAMAKGGMVDCALELDQLDGASFKDGKSNKAGTARVSCVLNFYELTDPTEFEYVPARYDGIVRRIAGPLRPRTFLTSVALLPTDGETSLDEEYYPSSRTWKLVVRSIGGDFASSMEEVLKTALERRDASLQVTLNMACPCIGAATEYLRGQGFFFGGLAPRWFGTDGLLMQKLWGEDTDYANTKLYTHASRELLTFIRSDREAVPATTPG